MTEQGGVKSRDREPSEEYVRCCIDWIGGWGGRGPGQVWPEVNVFSLILLAGAVSSVIGRRGDSKRKGGLVAPKPQPG